MVAFRLGDEVLSHGKDGLFYFGQIVQLDTKKQQCLIRFDDNSEQWSLFKDVAKLKSEQSEDICDVCLESNLDADNKIVSCNYCGLSYHQQCHKPPIKKAHIDGWMCKKCFLNKEDPKLNRARKRGDCLKDNKRELPYNVRSYYSILNICAIQLQSLNWDINHYTNEEQIYCYCGGPGEWYNKMIQCGRCQQWFHEACLECLDYPVFYGDRFYIFACSICNFGEEYIHRMPMDWEDVVHLILFNLHTEYGRPFYDFHSIIMPYAHEHWDMFQLPASLAGAQPKERLQNILRFLCNSHTKFRSGPEVKKRTGLYGLRDVKAPEAPLLYLPREGKITDAVIRSLKLQNMQKKLEEKLKSACELSDISKKSKIKLEGEFNTTDAGNKKENSRSRKLEFLSTGSNQQITGSGLSKSKLTEKGKTALLAENENGQATVYLENLHIEEYHSTDKNYVHIKKSKYISLSNQKRKPGRKSHLKLKNGLNTLHARKLLNKAIQKSNGIKQENFNLHPLSAETSGDESSSRGTLDSFIPVPHNFDGQNNPFHSFVTYMQPTLARPIARQLSEKDIKITKNGEIRRRKIRQKRQQEIMFSEEIGNGSFVAKYADMITPGTACMTTSNPIVNSALMPSPIKSAAGSGSMEELKSTVNCYFGAETRIAAGEKFSLIARRVTSKDQIQFLIEWEGPKT